MNLETGITVLGGGPAGVASALALIESGFKVTLVERSDYNEIRAGEHLLPEAKPLLAQLKVPKSVWDKNCFECSEILSVWGTSKLSHNESIWNPYGGGVILNRSFFDSNLADYAEQCGATLLKNTSFVSCKREKNRWTLDLKRDGKIVNMEADFLIDATGRSSRVVKSLNGKHVEYDGLICIAGFINPEKNNNQKAPYVLLEACRDGWWYSVQLFDGRMVATYMTDRDMLVDSKQKPLEFWKDRLEESPHTQSRLRAYDAPAEVFIRPSQSHKLETVYGDGWLAVGDSAISCDPLSSAGILKGFKMGIQAAETIQKHFDGDTEAFDKYNQQVKKDFDEYLKTRAYYYRLVMRWPKSKFWTRRHSELPSDTPIYLDPMTLVSLSDDACQEDANSGYDSIIPEINSNLLTKIASSIMPAHRLVSLYKSESKCQNQDQNIIIAIQYLLEAGILKMGVV